MRRAVAWAVTAAWMLALLSGCAGTPQSRESGATVLAGVLGVEDLGEGFCIRAAAEGRGSQGPFHCESWGQTPAAAVEDLTDRAEQVVSCYLPCSAMPFRSRSRARRRSCGSSRAAGWTSSLTENGTWPGA